jgi:hypothetical protein
VLTPIHDDVSSAWKTQLEQTDLPESVRDYLLTAVAAEPPPSADAILRVLTDLSGEPAA